MSGSDSTADRRDDPPSLRTRLLDATAWLLGLLGMIFGAGMMILIGIGIERSMLEESISFQEFVRRASHRRDMAYWLVPVVAIGIPSLVGLVLAKRGERPPRRISLAGSAVRFGWAGVASALLVLSFPLVLVFLRVVVYRMPW